MLSRVRDKFIISQGRGRDKQLFHGLSKSGNRFSCGSGLAEENTFKGISIKRTGDAGREINLMYFFLNPMNAGIVPRAYNHLYRKLSEHSKF